MPSASIFSVREKKKEKNVLKIPLSFLYKGKFFKKTQMLQSEQEEHILLKMRIVLILPMTVPFLLTCM